MHNVREADIGYDHVHHVVQVMIPTPLLRHPFAIRTGTITQGMESRHFTSWTGSLGHWSLVDEGHIPMGLGDKWEVDGLAQLELQFPQSFICTHSLVF